MKIKPTVTHVLAAAATALLLTAAGPAASHQMKSKAKHSHAHSQTMKKPAARMSGTCEGGGTWQDRQTCMKEAAAAKAAAQRGNLATGEDANFARNRTLRCQGLPAGDRDACVARMSDPTNMSGSVTEGGILYEAKQMVPAGTAGGTTMNQPPARNSMQQQRSMQQRSMQQRKAMPKQPPLNQ